MGNYNLSLSNIYALTLKGSAFTQCLPKTFSNIAFSLLTQNRSWESHTVIMCL